MGRGVTSGIVSSFQWPCEFWNSLCSSHLSDATHRKGRGWTHEQGSEMMFDYLIEDKGIKLSPKDADFIKALIAGEPSKCRYIRVFFVSFSAWRFRLYSEDEKPFLFDIVANKRNGIDVDKFVPGQFTQAWATNNWKIFAGSTTLHEILIWLVTREICPLIGGWFYIYHSSSSLSIRYAYSNIG